MGSLVFSELQMALLSSGLSLESLETCHKGKESLNQAEGSHLNSRVMERVYFHSFSPPKGFRNTQQNSEQNYGVTG